VADRRGGMETIPSKLVLGSNLKRPCTYECDRIQDVKYDLSFKLQVRPEVEECPEDVLIDQIVGKGCPDASEYIKSPSKPKVEIRSVNGSGYKRPLMP
jgi:hypothetical protein